MLNHPSVVREPEPAISCRVASNVPQILPFDLAERVATLNRGDIRRSSILRSSKTVRVLSRTSIGER